MPEGQRFSGRIISIASEKIFLTNGESVQITPRTRLLPAQSIVQGTDILSILLPGDLISVGDSEIHLLAPQTQEFSLQLRAPTRERLQQFSDFLSQVRSFFQKRGFLEVQTPGLVIGPGTEPYLDVFQSEFRQGKKAQKLYLPTSPELHLKKLLAMDRGPLFEIKNCFRNGEQSPVHEPEFQMLEWYRPFSNLEAIAEDVQAMLQTLSGQPKLSLKKQTMSGLFQQKLHFKLTPQTTLEELQSLAKALDISASGSIDDVFNQIFVERIEPELLSEEPILLHHYPPYLAAYSRLTESGWADRFEIYWKGMELANAFHEINDPKLQRQRMLADLEKKRKIGKDPVPLDEEFLQALSSGMPPSGGIALGLERLFMCLHGIENIQQLKAFPYARLFSAVDVVF